MKITGPINWNFQHPVLWTSFGGPPLVNVSVWKKKSFFLTKYYDDSFRKKKCFWQKWSGCEEIQICILHIFRKKMPFEISSSKNSYFWTRTVVFYNHLKNKTSLFRWLFLFQNHPSCHFLCWVKTRNMEFFCLKPMLNHYQENLVKREFWETRKMSKYTNEVQNIVTKFTFGLSNFCWTNCSNCPNGNISFACIFLLSIASFL